MTEFYNPKKLVPDTRTKALFDQEVSVNKAYRIDFRSISNPNLKTKLRIHGTRGYGGKPYESIFSLNGLLFENYKVGCKISNLRPPIIQLKSKLPLLNNLECVTKFSPRINKNEDTFDSYIGLTYASEGIKISPIVCFSDDKSIILKSSVYPWRGLFWKSFFHYKVSELRVIDYSAIIGYETNNFEVYFQHSYADLWKSFGRAIRSLNIGAFYAIRPNLSAGVLILDQESENQGNLKKKIVLGCHYNVNKNDSIKVKFDQIQYSISYIKKFSENFVLNLRTGGYYFDRPDSDKKGLSFSLNVEI